MDDPQVSAPKHLSYIDSLRGLAILMVIAVHVHQIVPGLGIIGKVAIVGQMGVQLFFVISAYTLSMTFPHQGSVPAFYVRRFFRIAPLYYLAFVFYALWQSLLEGRGFQPPSGLSVEPVAENLLFVQVLDPRYISGAVPGGWSISTEMLFYLIFPLLIWAASVVLVQFGKWALVTLIAASSCLLVGSADLMVDALSGSKGATIMNGGWMYYFPLIQVPVFLVGIGMFLLTGDRIGRTGTGVDVGGLIFFAALSSICWNSSDPVVFSFMPAVAAIGFAFVFRLVASHPRSLSWLRAIGARSYSIYIIHFLFAWNLTGVLSPMLSPQLGPALTYVVCYGSSIAGSFIVATLTERWIERPGIAVGKSIARLLPVAAKSQIC